MGEGSVLATLGSVVSYLVGQFTDMAETILDTPLALVGLGFFVIGGSIGLVKRIIH
jgi:hypothetical protein